MNIQNAFMILLKYSCSDTDKMKISVVSVIIDKLWKRLRWDTTLQQNFEVYSTKSGYCQKEDIATV